MKKIYILIAILVVLGVGFYLYNKNKSQTPQVGSTNQTTNQIASQTPVTTPNTGTQVNTNPNGPDYTPPQTGGETPAPDIQVVEVDFTGSAFSPATVTINKGDWVFFKNTSNTDMWVASNPHPTHTDYPGFDAKQNIAPGGEYKFQFEKVGSWGYHDHLDPSIGGTVVVK